MEFIEKDPIESGGRHIMIENLKRIAKAKRGWNLEYLTKGVKNVSDEVSQFIACRHWNSNTPVIPRVMGEYKSIDKMSGAIGGGYYIRFKNIGIAIDPGHGFIKTLFESHDISLSALEIIIITHGDETKKRKYFT